MSLKIDRVQIEIEIKNDTSRIRARELEGDLKKLRTELKKLPEGTDAWIKKSAELKKVQIEYDKIIDKIGIAGLSMKELRMKQRELNAIIGQMSPKAKSYGALQTQLGAVNARMKQLRGNAQATGLSIGKMANGFNKYFGMIGIFAASFTGAVLGFRKLVDIANNFEERADNLSAITGLMGEELDWLTEKAKETSVATIEGNIKIKQSADAIVDAYTKVGSQRPELLKNKEALHAVTQDAIILSEAAKIELEPAVAGLTMAMNQLNYEATESGRIINVMAAGSKEGSADIPYLTEAFEKSGTTARLMNIDIEELAGTIEAVAPSYSKASMAGNSFDKVLLKLKAGNIGYVDGQFNLIAAIEELEKKYASGTTAADLFGVEHSKMGELLVLNKEDIIKYTAAVTDTNIAMEQAEKNTNNNAASLAQAKNKYQLVAIELGTKLAPALTFSTNGFSYLMKAMMASIEIWKEYKGYIITGAAAIGVYTAAVKIGVYWDEISVLWKKRKVLWNEKVVQSIKKIQKLNRSQVWGLIAAGITLAVGALIAYNNKMTVTEKIMKDFNKQLAESQGALTSEFEALKKTNEGTNERAKAIKSINEKYGDYLDNLLTEKSTLEEIEAAQKKATEAMYEDMLMKNKKDAFAKVYAKYQEEQLEIVKNLTATEGENTEAIINQAKALAQYRHGSQEWIEQKQKGALASEAGRKNAASLAASYNNMNNQLNILSATFGKMTKKKDANNESSKTEIEQINDNIKMLKKHQKQFDENSKAYKNIQQGIDRLIIKRDELIKKEKEGSLANKELTDEEKKRIETQYQEQRKLQKLIISNMEESFTKQVAMENWRYEGIVHSADREIEHQQTKNLILEQEELAHQRRLNEIIIGEDMLSINDAGIDAPEEVEYEEDADVQAALDQQADMMLQSEWELDLFYQTAEGKKAILKEQLDFQQISYAEYTAAIKQIDTISLETKLAASAGAMSKMAGIFQKESIAYKLFASGEAIIATYLGASKDLAEGPPYVKYLMAAATIASGLANVAKINGVAFAKGHYPMQTQDGMYNVAYGGSPTTQIVSSPTHFVAGEQGANFPEMIVDGPTFNFAKANYPGAIDAIMNSRSRVKGYADGYYPESAQSDTISATEQSKALMDVLAQNNNLLTKLDKEGVGVSYNKLTEAQAEVSEIEAEISG